MKSYSSASPHIILLRVPWLGIGTMEPRNSTHFPEHESLFLITPLISEDDEISLEIYLSGEIHYGAITRFPGFPGID